MRLGGILDKRIDKIQKQMMEESVHLQAKQIHEQEEAHKKLTEAQVTQQSMDAVLTSLQQF